MRHVARFAKSVVLAASTTAVLLFCLVGLALGVVMIHDAEPAWWVVATSIVLAALIAGVVVSLMFVGIIHATRSTLRGGTAPSGSLLAGAVTTAGLITVVYSVDGAALWVQGACLLPMMALAIVAIMSIADCHRSLWWSVPERSG